MGRIKKSRRVTSLNHPSGIIKEFIINKPNMSPWEFLRDDGMVRHRKCGGIIVKRPRKIPGKRRIDYAKNYLMCSNYTSRGKPFCWECGDIMGRQAIKAMNEIKGLHLYPFNDERAHPITGLMEQVRLWCHCFPVGDAPLAEPEAQEVEEPF